MKKFIKKILGKKLTCKLRFSKFLYHKLNRKEKSYAQMAKCILKTKIYTGKTSGESLKKLFSKINLTGLSQNDSFYYNIDRFACNDSLYMYDLIGNLSIDYKKVLDYSLNDYKEKLNNAKKDEAFYNNELSTIEGIEILIDRITSKLEKENCNSKIIENIKNIKNKKAENFYEALQRILFFNQLLWQTWHSLNGLGRLDMILIPYYEKDIKNGVLSEKEARNLLKEFLSILHRYYEIKSNVLLGDTGQVIELGGKDLNGNYQCNKLTFMFIELMEELKLPDPKVLLRVSNNMPRELMETSLKCIKTGIGCPLFANDDVVIDKLIEFGYSKEDSYNYGTSACWEPYMIGKAFDQNNIKSVVFMKPFEILLEKEDITKIKNINDLINIYKEYLEEYLNNFLDEVNKLRWQEDPLLSLFIDDCITRNKDVTNGGALYNDYGFTGVGLANLVNSIINVEELVFEKKEITFEELNKARKNNFETYEELANKLKSQPIKYGTDNSKVIEISNDIIKFATQIFNKQKNYLGGKYKFGLSAPSYIDESVNFPASFDGRKVGEPFSVHISSDKSEAYTELIQFASKLDYNENRFNGNVVDFFVSPSFIEDNFEKFVDFLMLSINVGFFEMQMNVVSSKQLIEARKNPEKFPNLIVRVWGFSAYFNDLPDNYKDYLIERAKQSERN